MSEPRTVTLPNGDLWSPRYGERPDNMSAQTQRAPTGKDKLARVLDELPDQSCPWCGQDCGTKPALRTHVEARHKSEIAEGFESMQDAVRAAGMRASARASEPSEA